MGEERVAQSLDPGRERIALRGVGRLPPRREQWFEHGELRGHLGMLGPHLLDVERTGGCARGEPIPEHEIFALVVQVERVEVDLGVVADDRGALAIAVADLPDQQRQLSIQPPEDAMHLGEFGCVAAEHPPPRGFGSDELGSLSTISTPGSAPTASAVDDSQHGQPGGYPPRAVARISPPTDWG